MPRPTHLFFDFFGTLVTYSESRVDQGFEQSYALLLEHGASIDYASFLARWDATFGELEARALQNLDEYSMAAVCGPFLAEVLPRSPGDATLALFRDTYLAEWNKGVEYIAGVPELLAELASDFTLVLVTNTHHAALVHGHLGVMNIAHYFSAIVTSVEHGRRKPSACIFEHALAISAGERATSIHIGDSFAADYVGASNAGLRCLLIDPEHRHDVPGSNRLEHILDAREVLARLTER